MFSASRVNEPGFLDKPLNEWRELITQNTYVSEPDYLVELLALLNADEKSIQRVTEKSVAFVEHVRAENRDKQGVEAFLQQYSLSTQEGVILMCLAEALLRIPDADVANRLIADKLKLADWDKHVGQSESLLVNMSTWGLMLTGKWMNLHEDGDTRPSALLNRLVQSAGEPVIRQAMNQAMKLMGRQFVLGRTIEEALERARKSHSRGYTHSFDMLGEAAFTAEDAVRYKEAYRMAIRAIGAQKKPERVPPGTISIKLSALHPRYEESKCERVLNELTATLIELAVEARQLDVYITIDAEEADRLELSLRVIENVLRHDSLKGWNGFGLVVQAYSKRALPVLCYLQKLAKDIGKNIPLRLVKGAYWDSEIKWSQMAGLPGYPVYTRKAATDVSYLACAKFLLGKMDCFYPQFATHNAQTVQTILDMAGEKRGFEFQRLHGMGEALYDTLIAEHPELYCRVYAPVGAHKDLLPYLVRRLLENGANTSFVHQLVDEDTPSSMLVQHPVLKLQSFKTLHNARIPLPPHIFGAARMNSAGTNLNIQAQRDPFIAEVNSFNQKQWHATGLINGKPVSGDAKPVFNPANTEEKVGSVVRVTKAQAEEALSIAYRAQEGWNATPAERRAAILDKIADLFEQHKYELIAICGREAGKTLQDGIDEVREAVDFCRYYAERARLEFAKPLALPGPTGERNELFLDGRGVFACIAPWNFPLAIFTGQVVAALVAGNSVLAKPANQTCLIAHRAVELMLQAGVPGEVLHFLPGSGAELSPVLTEDPRIAGVAFTGSTETAWTINRSLASRRAQIAALIAETGGQNAMIVDSSALPEQVVADVIRSAFVSAGQRCSALRVLYLQEEIAERVIEVLRGAMAELVLGNPLDHKTDIGPVIDAAAKKDLETHIQNMRATKKLLAEGKLPADANKGHFLAPIAFEIDNINDLKQENFGPVAHIIRYKSDDLDKVIDSINAYGYGLTIGIHTRNEATADYIAKRARVGNVYINRNQVGAVVGVQPFGGQGLSGTGPKAGGPHYLHRFATERTVSNNIAAVGGNATLLSLGDAE
ncbi:bifunctional proline dehydrogenase/L-glutamate gamma-semialdehyde dehydrogenase PutA [Permianibacter aggregans]|uniref:Bifunctional protein PutA n=1 Tax=Permianibacter aggregans TaxID=1510150 RepID=A0A4R6UB67_9GAMM|nr:bifunctional proline dehydrogenase/L-glutamate gamma-semialdehyde dehydrogenase PutA [Permianibacter aggregans]QGX40554.1 bifunctional proline dehydrogenase/L-glutamate gamma-semialdehyde dehydrogenase PutA [Permianibacter aggregans]TDQ43888.1 L-proline dehydrogenase /delta-1-pyrroline-5-carboxylate dehydrogenase [Permianibacter aggregans]